MSGLCITKLDVLDGLDEIKIATKYTLNGKEIDYFPSCATSLSQCKPIYETHDGWKSSTKGLFSWDELPTNATRYLTRLSELTETPISIISTGPDRSETIVIESPFGCL